MRKATLTRSTRETDIALKLTIEGRGRYAVSTGIRFFDHMLELFARHGAFDLVLRVTGETLRRKRRHSVERRAAMATLKMTIPLVTMILPPLFLVVLGPGVLQLIGAVHLVK